MKQLPFGYLLRLWMDSLFPAESQGWTMLHLSCNGLSIHKTDRIYLN